MFVMKTLYFWGALLTCLSSVASEFDDPSSTMMRWTYCACRCCEKNQASCFRHPSIPEDFKCSESTCGDTLCSLWEKAKCSKDCYCNKCKSKLAKNDYKCISFKSLPKSCKCEKTIDCDKVPAQSPGTAKEMDEVSKKIGRLDCVTPCLCERCKDTLPPALYTDCLKAEKPDADCNCQAVKCPSAELVGALEKVEERRKQAQEDGTEYNLSDEIDKQMGPEEAKKAKCQMQCYCDACSHTNEKIGSSCEGMLPKKRVEGCECDPDKISCPMEDMDKHCKLYCFCKGCMKDARMSIETLQGCQKLTEKEQDCLCADKENCKMLDKLVKMEEENKKLQQKEKQQEKEQPKKGKLKPKKKDRDEL